jgi:hypothetical protein
MPKYTVLKLERYEYKVDNDTVRFNLYKVSNDTVRLKLYKASDDTVRLNLHKVGAGKLNLF